MRYLTLIAPFALLALPSVAAGADCTPVFLNGDVAVTIDGVEIEPNGRARDTFQVRVQNSSDSASNPGGAGSLPCGATIRVARIGNPNPDFPPYVLSAQGNRQIEILPDPAASGTADSDINIANAPPGTRGAAVPFRLVVGTEWGLRAGTYVEQLQLSLYDETGNLVDQKTSTITIIIPSAISVRIVGAVVGDGEIGPAMVDLGNLSSTIETRSQPFAARILSTSPYAMSFSSINLGNLLHEQASEEVPYKLFFEGNRVDLAGANEFPYPYPTPQAGDTRPLSIVVSPVVTLAGRYSDRITVLVTTAL